MFDRYKIGKDLIAWSKDNPEALTIPMFSKDIDGLHSEMMRDWCSDDPIFSAMYREAKENIGINRLRANLEKRLSDNVYTKTLHYFDIDSKKDMREEKLHDAAIEKSLIKYKHKIDEKVQISRDELQKRAQKGEYTQE